MKKLVAAVGVAVLAAMETFAATDVAGDGAETSRATLYRTTAEAPFRVRDCPLPSKLTSAGANVIDLDAAAPGDDGLAHFSIDEDRRFVLPAIRAARAVNPDITFFASPWSPPGWMKASGSLCGGQVKPSAYPTCRCT